MKRRGSAIKYPSPSTRRQKVVPSESEDHDEDEDEDENKDFEEDLEDANTYRHHQIETAADRDFIEDDDPDAEIGVPDMPLEFSKFASAKTKTLFRHVVEWVLNKHLNPSFEETDLQRFAFGRLGDQIKGLVHSYMSSVWTPEFTYTLLARPQYNEWELKESERVLYPNCEACNRTKHPASWAIQFSKHAYDKKTLEEVDAPNEDYEGRKIARMSKVFHLGRDCADNARHGHPLVHWSYILYDHITEQWPAAQELKMDGHWSTAKKTKKIEQFVEEMQGNGQIKKIFQAFRDDIDVARKMKVEDW